MNFLKGLLLSKSENLKKQFYNTLKKQIVEIKEKPYKVALGCALGISINFIPTFGIGFILAFFLATLLKINQAGAAITSLLTGPLVPLMYALNFIIGGLILAPVMEKENLLDFIIGQYSLILKMGNFKEKILSILELFGLTFLVGSAINAIIFGLIVYLIVKVLLNKYIISKKE